MSETEFEELTIGDRVRWCFPHEEPQPGVIEDAWGDDDLSADGPGELARWVTIRYDDGVVDDANQSACAYLEREG